jgi:hypothetical protein
MISISKVQTFASLLWRWISAFHHHKLLSAPCLAGEKTESGFVSRSSGAGRVAHSSHHLAWVGIDEQQKTRAHARVFYN